MAYVDGYILVVEKKRINEYKRMARQGRRLWRKYGAVDYKECVLDDAKPAFGVPFPKIAKAKPGETVIFSWIVFKSKAHRNRVNAKVMTDPSMQGVDPSSMPGDMKRMGYGGFKVLVQ